MKIVALALLINQRNEVLLQHKDAGAPNHPNKWCLFGGSTEGSESPLRAMKRELEEELELQVDELDHFLSFVSADMRRDVFVCRIDFDADELRATLHEGDDLGYFSEEMLDQVDVAEPHRAIISEYYRQSAKKG